MANQRRNGGNQKITTPSYNERGVIRAERVIENAYDLAVNQRLFQDASIPAAKVVGGGGGGGDTGSIYRASLTQSGASNVPVDTVIQNDLGTYQWLYSGAGEYAIVFDNSVLVSGLTKVLLSSGQWDGNFWAYYVDANTVYIKTGNFSGTLQDDWLVETFFEIIVYPAP